MCAPRSGGIKPQSISSNIEKLVVILTSVGLMSACLVIQLGLGTVIKARIPNDGRVVQIRQAIK